MNDRSLKAVFFDLDGTITDTEKIYQKHWVNTIRDFGFPDFPDDGALELRSINSVDGNVLMKGRLGEKFDYDAIHDLMKKAVVDELTRDGVPLKPGISEALSFLSENHIHSVVVTSTQKEDALLILESVGIDVLFDTVISAHEVPRGKPHPDPYLFALETISLKPSEAVAVEDSPNGARSALDAGLSTIMIPDLTPAPKELEGRLFAVIPSLLELPKAIKPLI
ncbi:MAG: HAD family phosphatase [Lachnospiraceae bacterium]|nr:HAD family phosphatase [Lachnospiraceae bacterium]